jgi:hypothetical protein
VNGDDKIQTGEDRRKPIDKVEADRRTYEFE